MAVFFGVTTAWGQNDMVASTLDARVGAEEVLSGPRRQRMGTGGDATRRSSPFGAENNPHASKNDPEGAQWGGARFTPHKNVVIGRRGGKPLAKFLREGVLGVMIMLVVVTWVAKPVSAIVPVEVAWWKGGSDSAPPTTRMQGNGAVASRVV